jgi:cyclase
MTNPKVTISHIAQKTDIERLPFVPKIRVSRINNYILCFYDGRNATDYPEWLHHNIDMQLGVCCYVLHRGDEAIIFDTMLYKEHILWIDDYLRQIGIKTFSVINSHWDCDHIAGNFLYKDRDIISTKLTRWKMQSHENMFRTGEIWAMAGDPYYPGVEDFVLPNRTFEGHMTLYLKDIRIELIETFVHQIGHLVAYLPQDKILLAADACEDTVPFNTPSMTIELPIQLRTYHRMMEMDITKVLPCHGRFEVIDGGGYTKEFIAAMIDYETNLFNRRNEGGYLQAPLESFIEPWVQRGVLALHEPYRSLHEHNVDQVHKLIGSRSVSLATL